MPFCVVTDIMLPFEKYDVMVHAFRYSVMKFVLIKKSENNRWENVFLISFKLAVSLSLIYDALIFHLISKTCKFSMCVTIFVLRNN